MLQSYAEKRERFNIAFCCQLLLARDEVTRDLKDKKNVLWKKKKAALKANERHHAFVLNCTLQHRYFMRNQYIIWKKNAFKIQSYP